jgi:hypothetical protein
MKDLPVLRPNECLFVTCDGGRDSRATLELLRWIRNWQ